jgi:hypothetical protein
MQALTGLFARQFGTPNYAAHGGFCSVNMAAGMIYTIGGSFWEFGGPDLDRAKLFVMIGTAEDHHSNPMKIALSKFKRNGGRFVSINPVRTGYSAIADEWVPIKPGTDGALLLALIHEIIAQGLYDRDFLVRYTNAGQLVNQDAKSDEFGLMLRKVPRRRSTRCDPHNFYWWDRCTGQAGGRPHRGLPTRPARRIQACPTARRSKPPSSCWKERVRDYTPEWAERHHRHPGRDHPRLATRWASPRATRRSSCPSPGPIAGASEHESVTGNPVAFHAMRGLAAHSNGFHTIRALAILMSLLGTIDRPGGFRHKAPYPRAVPPNAARPRGPRRQARHAARRRAAGLAGEPDDLFVDAAGEPVRIDKGFSWEYPLSAHGLMHNVITNAWRGDPYPHRHAADLHGQHGLELDHEHVRGPEDAQRQGADRANTRSPSSPSATPSSRDDGLRRPDPARHHLPRAPRRDVACWTGRSASSTARWIRCAFRCCRRRASASPSRRCWSNWVAPEAAGLHHEGRHAQVPRLPGLHRQLRDRAGLGHRLPRRLARQGRREIHARRAEPAAVGDVRAEQLRLPPRAAEVHQYMRNWNHGYMQWAQRNGLRRDADPDRHPPLFRVPAALPPRGAGQGITAGSRRTTCAQRVQTYFDPLPFYLRAAGVQATDTHKLPARRGDAAADGDVPLLGLAERLAAADPRAQLPARQPRTARPPASPTATGCGSSRSGARCAAWRAIPRRWSRARCGPGTPSARPPAPGT